MTSKVKLAQSLNCHSSTSNQTNFIILPNYISKTSCNNDVNAYNKQWQYKEHNCTKQVELFYTVTYAVIISQIIF